MSVLPLKVMDSEPPVQVTDTDQNLVTQEVPWKLMEPYGLVEIISNLLEKVLIIDSRSFLEFNTCHIRHSVNVCCSKLVKRRLQHDKVHIKDLLAQTCHIDADENAEIIVYDQCTEEPAYLTGDNFLVVLLQKLSSAYKSVTLLKGGFLVFQAMHPSLCESKSNKCTSLTSLSQPCLPISNVGPTRILHFLYLGSQRDAMSQDIIQVNGISYILNVTTTCKQPAFIQESHFLRIPINDNYFDKMLPYFHDAFQFLDKVREANGCVLIHCLAGISRSPTLAIAYVMRHLKMSSDDAYRYVKAKRPTISPNFNFLGQLLEYEKQLREDQEKAKKLAETSGKIIEVSRGGQFAMDLCSSPVSPVPKVHRTCGSMTSALCLPVTRQSQITTTATTTAASSSEVLTSTLAPTSVDEADSMHKTASTSGPTVPCSEPPSISCTSTISTTTTTTSTTTVTATSTITNTSIKSCSKLTLSPPSRPQTFTSLPFKTTLSPTPITSPLIQKLALSPTAALAKLNFSQNSVENMETLETVTVENILQLHKFPTTSLDKLSFTPCFAKDEIDNGSGSNVLNKDSNISDSGTTTPITTPTTTTTTTTTTSLTSLATTCMTVRPRNTAVKRPKSSSLSSSSCSSTSTSDGIDSKFIEPLSPSSTSSSSTSSSSTSSSAVTSPTTANSSKVILRSRENRAKRPLVRPNSIAFSTYPTFDLGSDCQESPGSSSTTSQDDTSEAYLLHNGKKSKPSESGGHWPYGRYSERHVYKQIAAAMESAMVRTHVFENSRKSRSLDDILTSEEDPAVLECPCSPLDKLPRRCGASADIYSKGIFENLTCHIRGSSDSYQSSSSISSSGSHSSLHGSLEIIQPPR
ncbi:tyrosine-protein phosphatase vhp-1-like isoform X2 [Octopus sinensis]|uniref:protein-tyrosine-phosphatase n=1 Tax=Octopus sinensis TaxID=2607531 RepID=A0A6P7T874_9MOLL|nr:tyrosine-protein phosphatase vhp-1-like isoform X2 [Octopus sinensis]